MGRDWRHHRQRPGQRQSENAHLRSPLIFGRNAEATTVRFRGEFRRVNRECLLPSARVARSPLLGSSAPNPNRPLHFAAPTRRAAGRQGLTAPRRDVGTFSLRSRQRRSDPLRFLIISLDAQGLSAQEQAIRRCATRARIDADCRGRFKLRPNQVAGFGNYVRGSLRLANAPTFDRRRTRRALP
jgi:hypothetical protein